MGSGAEWLRQSKGVVVAVVFCPVCDSSVYLSLDENVCPVCTGSLIETEEAIRDRILPSA